MENWNQNPIQLGIDPEDVDTLYMDAFFIIKGGVAEALEIERRSRGVSPR